MDNKKFKVVDSRGDDMAKPQKEVTEQEAIPTAPDYTKINLVMQGDRLLLQQFPKSEKIGAIFTPDNMEISIDKARVVGIGPDVKNIKVGQVICKVHGLGQRLKTNDGTEYIFLPENSAIAIDTDYDESCDSCVPSESKHDGGPATGSLL